MADWYWMKNGEKHGPVDTAHLKQLARTGQIEPTDTIWREGLPNWVPASQANGLEFGASHSAHGGTSVATAPARPSRQPVSSRGIIKYRCVHCGGGLESEGRLAGKQDTCPMCSKATPVPLTSTMGAGAFFRKIPKPVYIGTAAVVLVAVVSLTAWLALRDTWERDHGPELRQMSEQTISLIRAGKDEEGVAKYEAMLALVGDRQLEDPLLRQAVADAREKAEPAWRKVNEAKNLARLRSLEDQAKAFAASGEVRRAVDAYREALDLIQQADTGNPEFAAAIQRISGPKRQLEGQLAAIEAEEARRREEQKQREQQAAHEREMREKGYIRYRGKWMSPDEYAQAKATFPAAEIRKGIESYPHASEGRYIVKAIQIRKSDDIEYPYVIEITVTSELRVLIDSYADQGVYTFRVDGDLNLSDSYSIRGGERSGEASNLAKCLVQVLGRLKRSG